MLYTGNIMREVVTQLDQGNFKYKQNKAIIRKWSKNKNMLLYCNLPLCFAQYWICSTKFESVVF